MLRWLFLLCWTPLLFAQADEIRTLLQNSAAAWNRGDLAAFASDYEDSPETTFIGREVTRGGTQAILERYRRSYPDRDAMGKLAFTHLAIRVLDSGYAIATGNFHLERTAAGGGNADGIFSLLLKQEPQGWKIILDHSNRTN